MKKTAITGLMASILMATGAAVAATDEAATSLTTKNYVDSGLRAVYQTTSSAISENASAIQGLTSTVGGNSQDISTLTSIIGSVATESGLAYDVSELQTAVQNLGGGEGLGAKANQSDLTAEIERATAAEQANATAISAEAERAAAAEQANASAISAETQRATAAEQANASAISALQSTVGGLDGVAYEGENGVYVQDHKVGLDVEADEGEMYIYTSEGWAPLPIENTWDASILED